MGPEVFNVASLGSKTNTKTLILCAFDASTFSAIIVNLLLEFYSIVAILYLYLLRFDLMIRTFLDVIFRNKTHADIFV